jgi:hypothetical protein
MVDEIAAQAHSEDMSKTVQMKCGKCDGKGSLNGFMHYDNGKCYGCMGSGTVTCQPVSVRAQKRFEAACTVDALAEAGDRMLDVNPKWTAHMVKRAATAMLAMQDRPAAIKLLSELPAALRAAVIAEGNAQKAS